MNQNKKIALVTGGSRGLGKNMALAIAKKGIDVVLTYNSNNEEAEKVVSEIKALGQKAIALQLDIRNIGSFDNFTKEVSEYLTEENGSPNFDYLINNAGTSLYATIDTVNEEQVDDMFNTHYKGVLFLIQKSLPFLNDGGGIVNISSNLARFAFSNFSVYASMKGAIEVFTKYLAKELGPRGIRANIIAPGAIETDFGGGVVRDTKELNNYISSATALGRVGLPNDIGGVVAFLCTDDAGWINAQRIEVTGGHNI
ncbi:short-chain dehydrogenase [Flavobacterium akiainvivens]|uniref:Short-chain dehydrogenase n=1 Tax=Flavobacterium akiainvivens TaxID=1202724 RepID=A0A0N0RQK1_9FLAO|nr:SDR family oxidoreductase [Flavobacterium akiainvivens]KOS05749.1 short-chain dehydrogenase [Flavobacterium akiainvivens]SFQ37863.1 NAD(P)-dependent dehydrogenase, short-chain alcohol dehydrogenase family [Flavobacterium akiainvivens]